MLNRKVPDIDKNKDDYMARMEFFDYFCVRIMRIRKSTHIHSNA